MKKINRELECISRYIELASVEDVITKLVDIGIITSHEVSSIIASSSPNKEIHKAISLAKQDGRLQLLEYEWQFLPKEIIKITMVTDKSNADLSVAAF
jgi:hypothetical protein